MLLCGRYEGVDERVNTLFCDRELSIGDYVLTGGELAAAIVMDATTRLLPGVLGNEASSAYESFGVADAGASEEGEPPRSTHGSGGLLDYPHYTRPAEFRGLAVPEVLCGGDHAAIRKMAAGAGAAEDDAQPPGSVEGRRLERERARLPGLICERYG